MSHEPVLTECSIVATGERCAQVIPQSSVDRVRDFMAASKAANTLRGYRTDWNHFCGWCAERGLPSLPASPESVSIYLTEMSGRIRTGSLQRRVSAISQAHQAAGVNSPTHDFIVRSTMAGIRRVKGTAEAQKDALLPNDLRVLIGRTTDDLKGVRDTALLLVGFAGAFRRSELIALNVEDVEAKADGLVVTIRRSKTDQVGAGRIVGLPYGGDPLTCPVRRLQEWLDVTQIKTGAIFRAVGRGGRLKSNRLSDGDVARVIKVLAKRAGLNAHQLAGHSLRSGLATAAAEAGKSERSIMDQTGHRSVQTVRRYIRRGGLFRENAAAAIGL